MRLLFAKSILCAALSLAAFSASAAEELDLPLLPPPTEDPAGAPAPTLPVDLPLPAPVSEESTSTPPAETGTAPTETPAPVETGGLLMPPPPAESTTTETDTTTVTVTETVSIAPRTAEGGVPGVITGGRVNIRAGDSTKYEILTTANPDTPVTVFEKVGDWVKIAYPETEHCYISRQFIDGDIPADIPEQGLVRTIKGEHVNLRARPWPGSTVVGQVSTGDTVIVNGMRSQWARIRPPASARGWVFSKYVKYDSTGVKETAATATAVGSETAELRSAADNIKAKIKAGSKTAIINDKIKALAEAERKKREMFRQNTQRILAGLEDQLARIDQEAKTQVRVTYQRAEQRKETVKVNQEQILENYRPGPPPGSMGGQASGWVSYVGYLGGRPAGYKLTKGGETQYLLRSLRYNLDDFIGRRVLVSGTVKPAPAWEGDVMTVTRLSLFDDPDRTIDPVEVIRDETVTFESTTPETTVRVTEPETTNTRRVVIDVTGMK